MISFKRFFKFRIRVYWNMGSYLITQTLLVQFRICWLNPLQRSKISLTPKSGYLGYDTKLYLMVKIQFWISRIYAALFHWHWLSIIRIQRNLLPKTFLIFLDFIPSFSLSLSLFLSYTYIYQLLYMSRIWQQSQFFKWRLISSIS